MTKKTRPGRIARVGLVLLVSLAATPFCNVVTENFDLLGQLGGPLRAHAVSTTLVLVVEAGDLVAVDMGDPARPVELPRRPLESGAEADLILTNGIDAYVRTRSHGLQIYDYSDPRSPAYVGRFAPYDAYHPAAMVLEGDRLYFGGETFRIFDVADPAAPVELANHPYVSSRMAISEGRAVLTGDIRDPSGPKSWLKSRRAKQRLPPEARRTGRCSRRREEADRMTMTA